jgi:hypothetical protein
MAKTKTIKLNKNSVLADMYYALHLLEQQPLASNKGLQNFINSYSCTLMSIEDDEIKETNNRIYKKLNSLGLYDKHKNQ